MKKICFGILIGILIIFMCGCGRTEIKQTTSTQEDITLEDRTTEEKVSEPVTENSPKEERTDVDVIKDIIIYYGYYEDEADEKIEGLFTELEALNPSKANQWRTILDYWKYANNEMPINYDVLPDGLPEDDSLCMVVLGFALNSDGTMKPELEGRLQVTLKSAEKYPNAYVMCSGGGTASQNKSVTEAGKMAQWLIDKGVASERIIVEDDSMTTGQNAIFSYELLRNEYPQVTSIAVVTSDYHITRGALLLQAECILGDGNNGVPQVAVVSNGAYKTNYIEKNTLSYEAGGLLEIIGDPETAYDIYRGRFKAPEIK